MKQILILVLCFYTTWGFAQQIDNKNGAINFTVTNLGVNVEGRFRAFSGKASFDPDNLAQSHFEITIKAKSIHTGNKMRDEHLREEEYFDIGKHPEITFVSHEVIKEAEGYMVKGELEMKGVKKEISIPFTFETGKLSGEFELDRNDYGIGGSSKMNPIGDKVTIAIQVQL